MRLKLKENPREWQKFVGVIAFMIATLSALATRRGALSKRMLIGIGMVLALALITSWIRPRWFRGFYRMGMTLSFHIGQVMGRVLLTLFFYVVVTPMALILRGSGKDLLRLRRAPEAASYWQSARNGKNFERMF